MVNLRPKTYGPLVVASPDADTLDIATEAGHRAVGARTPQALGLSPSDLLLASLATCVSISMRMAAQQMGLTLGELITTAQATKAMDPPNRFARLDVKVQMQDDLGPEVVSELVRRTKALCTVSNTLGAEVVIDLIGL
jgi:uncharacterized OsmC-like protein